ncbi:hypothetical protein NPIL_649411 [Nephila pilipes]|uniref:Uncharacterized protein n=1 Tax=Nephila pilipes TaxID=299642 RepID=A0A8X6MYL5_NEPPI|nr:hypothetical protein NPIL_649411 [Nephila pilipes]
MAFFAKARKEDVRVLANKMGLILGQNLKILQIIDQIMKSPHCKEDAVKYLLCNIVEDRKTGKEKEWNAKKQAKLDKERENKYDKRSCDVKDNRSGRVCYDYGEPGVIKSCCLKRNLSCTNFTLRVEKALFQSCVVKSSQLALLNVTVKGFLYVQCM